MPAIENAYRSGVSVKLNGGVDPVGGSMIVKSCSLGKIVHGADKDGIMNVVGALASVLSYEPARVERTEVTFLETV